MKKTICLLVCVMNIMAGISQKWWRMEMCELRAINGPFNAIRVSAVSSYFWSQSDEEK